MLFRQAGPSLSKIRHLEKYPRFKSTFVLCVKNRSKTMDSGKFSYQVLLTLAKHSVEISVLSQIILDVWQLLDVSSHLCNHQIILKHLYGGLVRWSRLYPQVLFRCEGNVCLCRWEHKLYSVHSTLHYPLTFPKRQHCPPRWAEISTCPLPNSTQLSIWYDRSYV
jgi:hypothetical protein